MKPGVGDEEFFDGPPERLAARLRAEMARAGVKQVLAMGRWNAPADDPLGINGVLRIGTLVPGLHAIGICDPTRTDPQHLQRVEKVLADGKVKALKAYTGYLPFGPDHPAYVPYYRLAARFQIPVYFHTGDTWSHKAKLKYSHPLLVDEVAVDHPDVKFIIAHFGNPWLIDAAEVVYKNDNVWADLSGLIVGDNIVLREFLKLENIHASYTSGVLLEDLEKAYFYAERPSRFLYGSDWPLAPMDGYLRFIQEIIPRDHHDAVFQDNARTLFGLP
jgi:predicted TIM-barrel fold metal-dependent hydrolase